MSSIIKQENLTSEQEIHREYSRKFHKASIVTLGTLAGISVAAMLGHRYMQRDLSEASLQAFEDARNQYNLIDHFKDTRRQLNRYSNTHQPLLDSLDNELIKADNDLTTIVSSEPYRAGISDLKFNCVSSRPIMLGTALLGVVSLFGFAGYLSEMKKDEKRDLAQLRAQSP